MKIGVQSFKGVAPRLNPRYLPDGMAQECRNAEAIGWSLKPMQKPEDTNESVPSSTETLFLYNADGDSPLWLDWDSDVDVVKGQIANDTEKWIHYTGDRINGPRSTYGSIVYSGESIDMGVKPPQTKLTVSVVGDPPTDTTGETQETRVYVATFVRTVGGLSAESSPSPESEFVNLYPSTQSVDVTLPELEGSSNISEIRLYRSNAGQFLFLGQYPVAQAGTTINDDIPADELNETLPSLDWTQPPDDLEGLTNLPNGVVAGFVRKDIYFCVPYRPYAWPVGYMQSVDSDVVGLGAIDTTLVVLTTGEPYMIQGATPDSMVVVKGESPQSCVSKRSIVSAAGAVFYASPDGLIKLSSASLDIVTWEKFDQKTWQALNPSSFNAVYHEDKYIAFYDNGTEKGAFIYDLRTGEVSFSQVHAQAAFRDLFSDSLYYKAESSGEIMQWRADATSAQTALWRSKCYTMPRPTSFSCANVEAVGYPLTFRIYTDGELAHEQTVSGRDEFRLPALVGRDWEFELETKEEVFAVAIAQSVEELARG